MKKEGPVTYIILQLYRTSTCGVEPFSNIGNYNIAISFVSNAACLTGVSKIVDLGYVGFK